MISKTNIILIIIGVIGYLIGSLNFSIILSNSKKDDVRRHGSGNAGATNMLRTYGIKLALITFLLDAFKTIASYFIGYYVALHFGITETVGCAIFAATVCILGHCFPLYFGFKGGKGVTNCGILLILIDWKVAMIALAVFVLVVVITKYVSLASICGALTFAVVQLCMGGHNSGFYIYLFSLALFIVFMHRKNVVRLINGTENKISSKKK